jgi:hypothetical protein
MRRAAGGGPTFASVAEPKERFRDLSPSVPPPVDPSKPPPAGLEHPPSPSPTPAVSLHPAVESPPARNAIVQLDGPPPPAVDPTIAKRADTTAANALVHEKSKRIYETIQAMGFSPFAASLLTAHVFGTQKAPEHMGRTEIELWASTFMRMHPVPWFAIKTGNLMGFVSAMKISKLESLSAEQYAQLAAVIRN